MASTSITLNVCIYNLHSLQLCKYKRIYTIKHKTKSFLKNQKQVILLHLWMKINIKHLTKLKGQWKCPPSHPLELQGKLQQYHYPWVLVTKAGA